MIRSDGGPRSLSVLQQQVASAAGIPTELAARLNGGSVSELRADVERLRTDLGLVESQPRTPDGRYSFNDQLRTAAGYAPAGEPEVPTGRFGIGEGGVGMLGRQQPRSMTSLIRGRRQAMVERTYDVADMFE